MGPGGCLVQGRPQLFSGLSLRSPTLGLGTTGQVLKPRFQTCSATMVSGLIIHQRTEGFNPNALSDPYPAEVACSSVAHSLLLTPESLRHCQDPGPDIPKPGTWGLSKQMTLPHLLKL